MAWFTEHLQIQTSGKGLYEFTAEVNSIIRNHSVHDGMCHLFIQHTSASLCISENADPSAKADLERFLDRIAPEDQAWHRHTFEGPDDSPSHMKSILTDVSLSIPISHGKLDLGTWQGIYLAEHRHMSHQRRVVLKLQS